MNVINTTTTTTTFPPRHVTRPRLEGRGATLRRYDTCRDRTGAGLCQAVSRAGREPDGLEAVLNTPQLARQPALVAEDFRSGKEAFHVRHRMPMGAADWQPRRMSRSHRDQTPVLDIALLVPSFLVLFGLGLVILRPERLVLSRSREVQKREARGRFRQARSFTDCQLP